MQGNPVCPTLNEGIRMNSMESCKQLSLFPIVKEFPPFQGHGNSLENGNYENCLQLASELIFPHTLFSCKVRKPMSATFPLPPFTKGTHEFLLIANYGHY